MYRKLLHDKFGYFDDSMRFSADWKFHLKCAVGGTKAKKIQDTLGLYYFNPKGRTTDANLFPEKRKEEEAVYEEYKDIKLEEKNEK